MMLRNNSASDLNLAVTVSSGATGIVQRREIDVPANSARAFAQPPSAAHPQEHTVLSRINELFSASNINIDAQFLQTDATVGYVVIDVAADAAQSNELKDKLAAMGYGFKRSLPMKSRLPMGKPFQRRMSYAVAAWK